VTTSSTSRATGSSVRLRCVRGKQRGRIFELQDGALIGRSQAADFPIDDPSVSRRHAEIHSSEREPSVEDLGSANGTRVNGRWIKGRQTLKLGDRLQFGFVPSVFELVAPKPCPTRRTLPMAGCALLLGLAIAGAGIRAFLARRRTPELRAAVAAISKPDGGAARELVSPTVEAAPKRAGADGEAQTLSPSEARAAFLEDLAQRNEESEVVAALESYWDGRAAEARSRLKRLAARADARDPPEQLSALQDEISAAERLFKQGERQIAAGSPEAAKALFLKVLDSDRRLLNDLADRYPSYYRRKIQEDMARSSYAKGRRWIDRRNHRKACRAWKLGFEFYKGNADLNRAVALCSRRAAEALRKVRKCEQLLEVVDFAVDGDGLTGKIEQMRINLQCRV
jgi:hypothetical protein